MFLCSQDIKLISNKYSMHGGKQLVVSCKKEHFDSSKINEKIIYAVCYLIILIYIESIDIMLNSIIISGNYRSLLLSRWSQDTIRGQQIQTFSFYSFLMNMGVYCSVAIRISFHRHWQFFLGRNLIQILNSIVFLPFFLR